MTYSSTPPEAATSGGQSDARADGLGLSTRPYSNADSPRTRRPEVNIERRPR